MNLNETRSDIFGFRHSTVDMLCGAAGLLAGAARMIGVPHPAVVSVAGGACLALLGLDTVYATWRGPRKNRRPATLWADTSGAEPDSGINRRQLASYSIIAVVFCAAGVGLAAETAGATRVANIAGLILTLALALFFAAYVVLGDRASVRLTETMWRIRRGRCGEGSSHGPT